MSNGIKTPLFKEKKKKKRIVRNAVKKEKEQECT
jgi:hypothetical protein